MRGYIIAVLVLASITAVAAACPPSNLDADRIICRQQNLGAETHNDSNGCQYIKCIAPKPTCLTQNDLQNSIDSCTARGLQHYNKTENGCTIVYCTPAPVTDCPSADDVAKVSAACKAESGFLTSRTVDGCVHLECDTENRQSTACKKVTDINQCLLITCNDGFSYNSCTQQHECRVTCTYKQEGDCFVTSCADGFETRECKNTEVQCRAEKTVDGCIVKTCDDGTTSKYCPDVDCKEYEDDYGCQVKECADGSKTRNCPQENKTHEISCNAFIAGNCTIKECTNGLRINSCDNQTCTVDNLTNGCSTTKCTGGYVSRTCSGKETVECKTARDDAGCVLTACTDGFSSKNCPETDMAKLSRNEVAPRSFWQRILEVFS